MDARAQTLDVIEQYISTQRALLSRTQSDIDRLLKLRKEAIEKPKEFLDGSETNAPSFNLTDLSECAPALPGNVDWSLYASLDPTPLRKLAHNTTLSYSQTHPKAPHKTQRSALSPLQRFVKEARVSILEPVLGLGLSVGSGSGVSTPGGSGGASDMITMGVDGGIDGHGEGTDGDMDMRGGKKKKGGLTVVLPSQSHLQLRPRGSNGVFLPTPTSSSSTSISTPTANPSRPRTRRLTTAGRHSQASAIDLNTPTPSFPFTSPTSTPTPPPFPQHTTSQTQTTATSMRSRRPSAKFSKVDFTDSSPARRRSSTTVKYGEDVTMEPPTPTSSSAAVTTETAQPIKLGKRARRASSPPSFQPTHPHLPNTTNNNMTKTKTKIKPETYKQAWSVSEQHLLEKLLDEIPEGEKNRWQKISQAMQGRRTPRQVASRVQKYFEKLKRFGVGVGADDPGGNDGVS